MILVYIENKELLTQTINYLDNTDLYYTTDLETDYDLVLIAELTNKINTFIDKCLLNKKRVIFLTNLEMKKIYLNSKLNNKNSKIYMNKLINILNKCHKVIVSLPSIKNILKNKIKTNIEIIPKELPIINISRDSKEIYKKYNISKRKKKVVIIDLNYNNIQTLLELDTLYKKINFIYVGYKPDYLMTEQDKISLRKLSKNVTFIKYYNFNIISDILKVTNLVISFEDINLDIDYLYLILLFKKELLIKYSYLYDDYLINSKNAYIFKNKEGLFQKLKKIDENRVSKLADIGYELIKDNTFYGIVKKYNIYIR